MIISALKSSVGTDSRSPIHIDTISTLLNLGADVFFEENIGRGINVSDKIFEQSGLKKSSREDCLKKGDLIISNQPLGDDELKLIKPNSTLLGMINPFSNQSLIESCSKLKINLVSMEFIPRITRAQKMDVLSSQANLAGYVAVIESAKHLSTALPMMMTAAGTLKPAKVFVIGVGVAGLQAIATAKRMGAVVFSTDVRMASKEQVESLGGKFLTVEGSENLETEGGYAKEASDEFKKKQEELLSETLKKIDLIICTALIPGREAPKIIKEDMFKNLQSGSVIYDLAAVQGGNTVFTEVDKTVEKDGVKILGEANILNKLPVSASNLYAKNVFNFISNLYDKESKKLNINLEDEIIEKTLIK